MHMHAKFVWPYRLSRLPMQTRNYAGKCSYIYTCTDILAPKMIVKFFGGCEINDLDPSARFELVYLGVVADYVSSILPLLKNTVQRFSVVLAEKGPS